MNNNYYHVTSMENAELILRNGLEPRIGSESRAVGETIPYSYVCDEASIPYWQVLLGKSVVMQLYIQNPENYVHSTVQYDGYSEERLNVLVPAECIKLVHVQVNKREAVQHLCCNYLWTISMFCAECAKYYSAEYHDGAFHTPQQLNSLIQTGNAIVHILNRLDYGTVDAQQLQDELKTMGDSGEFTLCDTYYAESKRLWEKLTDYENDTLTELRSSIRSLLEKKLVGCLYTNTGGFC